MLFTYKHDLLVDTENCLGFLNFDVIVPLVKTFYLIQRNVK